MTIEDKNCTSTPRKIDRLLGTYALSHQNHRNELIHFVCVPVIVWTVLAALWLIHPVVALIGVGAALIYYASLSLTFAVGMLLMSLIMLGILTQIPTPFILPIALSAFVLAWIGQFIGHKIEGKKPSFFEDIQYLLIGPLFVLSFLYRRLKISY